MKIFRIEGMIGEEQNTAASIAEHFAANPGKTTVLINSPGGDAFEGAAMLAEVERHGGVEIIIEGIAASAASLIAIGGSDISMHAAAVFMIHEPASISFGSSQAHRKNAETLEKLTDVYAAAYSRATGNRIELIKQWMAEETWLGADEAVALNFCDRVSGDTDRESPPVAAFNYAKFKEPPKLLLDLTQKHGWAAISPASKSKGKENA
jgi:ATP-dependent protease ClpP protease subunit